MRRSGERDSFIKIQQRSLTRTATGEAVETWTDFANVWAKVRNMGGKEFFSAQKRTAEGTTSFYIDRIDGILNTMRIVHDGFYYDIDHFNSFGRAGGLEIIAVAQRG